MATSKRKVHRANFKAKVAKQCELAEVCRANWYNRRTVKPMAEQDLHLCRLID